MTRFAAAEPAPTFLGEEVVKVDGFASSVLIKVLLNVGLEEFGIRNLAANRTLRVGIGVVTSAMHTSGAVLPGIGCIRPVDLALEVIPPGTGIVRVVDGGGRVAIVRLLVRVLVPSDECGIWLEGWSISRIPQEGTVTSLTLACRLEVVWTGLMHVSRSSELLFKSSELRFVSRKVALS